MQAEQQLDMSEVDAAIDAWKAVTEDMTGKIVEERQPWVSSVTEDAIKHFAYGTDDDNPLWTDPAHAANSGTGRTQAPPAFVIVNRYPILHGAPMKAPLASLIGGVEVEWFGHVYAGDTLRSEPRQKEFFEKRNKDGRRLNFVISEIDYRNQDSSLVARATGTMIMATQDRPPDHGWSTRCRATTTARWSGSRPRGGASTAAARTPSSSRMSGKGARFPPSCAAPSPSATWWRGTRPSAPPTRPGAGATWTSARPCTPPWFNPVTGFPVKYSQQHEDANMAAGRGMPAPFDNGVMRFAWVAPLVTNWMGDDGFLKRLKVQVARPGLYGDLNHVLGPRHGHGRGNADGVPGHHRDPAGRHGEYPRRRGSGVAGPSVVIMGACVPSTSLGRPRYAQDERRKNPNRFILSPSTWFVLSLSKGSGRTERRPQPFPASFDLACPELVEGLGTNGKWSCPRSS